MAIALGLIAVLAFPVGRAWLDGTRLALAAAGLLSLGFVVPEAAVQRGLNDVALIFSATPRRDVPGYHGKDAAAAVDFVRWERRP